MIILICPVQGETVYLMIRTRTIIERLSYDKLVKQRIIPNLLPFIEQSQSTIAIKRYPPFVYSNKGDEKFSFFGVMMDYIIRAGLRINMSQKIELGVDHSVDIIQTLSDDKMMDIMRHINNSDTFRR
jgi:hypothetical protein